MSQARTDQAPEDFAFLTVPEAAEALHLSRRAVIHRIKAGTLPSIKTGQGKTNALLIPRAAVERIKGGAVA